MYTSISDCYFQTAAAGILVHNCKPSDLICCISFVQSPCRLRYFICQFDLTPATPSRALLSPAGLDLATLWSRSSGWLACSVPLKARPGQLIAMCGCCCGAGWKAGPCILQPWSHFKGTQRATFWYVSTHFRHWSGYNVLSRNFRGMQHEFYCKILLASRSFLASI